jgi:hypothetical protein
MFRASLCTSSGEQERDWLKLHVKMSGCAGCGCVELQSNNSFQKVHTAYTTAPHNHSQLYQASSHEVLTTLFLVSPDDGHNDARNMLRLI